MLDRERPVVNSLHREKPWNARVQAAVSMCRSMMGSQLAACRLRTRRSKTVPVIGSRLRRECMP